MLTIIWQCRVATDLPFVKKHSICELQYSKAQGNEAWLYGFLHTSCVPERWGGNILVGVLSPTWLCTIRYALLPNQTQHSVTQTQPDGRTFLRPVNSQDHQGWLPDTILLTPDIGVAVGPASDDAVTLGSPVNTCK